MQTASLSNCKGLVVLMLTITILAFVLGGLLGLIANVGVLIFAIASLGGKSTLCVSLAVAELWAKVGDGMRG
jgi:hypothetical protein